MKRTSRHSLQLRQQPQLYISAIALGCIHSEAFLKSATSLSSSLEQVECTAAQNQVNSLPFVTGRGFAHVPDAGKYLHYLFEVVLVQPRKRG